MKISIDKEILGEFPDAAIGYLAAEIEVRDSDPYVESMKSTLQRKMNEIGISADTMMDHPDVRRWREVFGKMGVKPSKYRSSLEALLRRLFKGEMWNVSNVVDLYNCVSVLNLLPMGAHDLAKLKGGLILRRGRAGEKFHPLGGDVIEVDPRNILYADDEKVTCWLWNHRDARESCVTGETKQAVFMIDHAFDTEWRTVAQGVAALSGELEKIGAKIIASGVVDVKNPLAEIDMAQR